jgi:hypothetical protein
LAGGKENIKEGESENSNLTLHSHSNGLKWGQKWNFTLILKTPPSPFYLVTNLPILGRLILVGLGGFVLPLLPQFF